MRDRRTARQRNRLDADDPNIPLSDGVVVGAGAKILGPIRVGANARIGANSVVIQDVAPGMTVVGIPGREVLPLHQRRITAQGIDLDHHLMPDPVGKALACLLERVNTLETLLGTGGDAPLARDPACSSCIDDCIPAPGTPTPGAFQRRDGCRDPRPLTDKETVLP